MRTKLSNGTIETLSGATAVKMLVGVNTAGLPATGAGIGATILIDKAAEKSCGCQ